MFGLLMHIISNWMTWLVLGYAAIIYAGFRKSLIIVTLVFLTLASTGLCTLTCTYGIRPFLSQLGDCQFYKLLHLFNSICSAEYGLPSTHSADGMAAATIFLWTTKGLIRKLALLSALMIGISRVYLGYHLPMDVISAIPIGLLIGTVVFALWLSGTRCFTTLLLKR